MEKEKGTLFFKALLQKRSSFYENHRNTNTTETPTLLPTVTSHTARSNKLFIVSSSVKSPISGPVRGVILHRSHMGKVGVLSVSRPVDAFIGNPACWGGCCMFRQGWTSSVCVLSCLGPTQLRPERSTAVAHRVLLSFGIYLRFFQVFFERIQVQQNVNPRSFSSFSEQSPAGIWCGWRCPGANTEPVSNTHIVQLTSGITTKL